MLTTLLSTPGANPKMVTVFIDGYFDVSKILTIFIDGYFDTSHSYSMWPRSRVTTLYKWFQIINVK